jgi:DNA-binding HxlR family transcriptional regulator
VEAVVSAPRRGRAARGGPGGKRGQPIMALLDLLGRRWALRIVWELRDGPLGFRALQAACAGIAPASLSQRLGELQAAGVVGDGAAGWQLSDEGQRLLTAMKPLRAWADRWARRG